MANMIRNKKYDIDIKTADEMLQNVFAACDTAPNKVPFEKIVSKSRQNLFSDNAFIVVAILIFVATFFCPLFFPHGSVFMSVDSSVGRPLTVVAHEMTEDTFSISFDGLSLDVANSYMVSADNAIILPMEYNRNTNTIVFPYTPSEYNIYVYDIKGKCLHLLLSPHS